MYKLPLGKTSATVTVILPVKLLLCWLSLSPSNAWVELKVLASVLFSVILKGNAPGKLNVGVAPRMVG